MGSYVTSDQQTGSLRDVDDLIDIALRHCAHMASCRSADGHYRIVHVDHTITTLPKEPHLTPQALVSVIMVFECVPKAPAALEPAQHA